MDYLIIGDGPAHLVCWRCCSCAAPYFGRRNACARCSSTAFEQDAVAVSGEIVAFSIVYVAPPDVAVPFVALIVDCEGVAVKGNLLDCTPDSQHDYLGERVVLDTYDMGPDEGGVHAVGFGFQMIDESRTV